MLYLSTAAKDGFRLGTGGDHPLALQALGPRAASSRWGNFDWPAVLLILVSLFRIPVVTSSDMRLDQRPGSQGSLQQGD